MKERLRFVSYLIFLFLPCLELALWILGYRPFHQEPFHIESTPEFCLIAHSRLGFGLMPGQFEVEINHALRYQVQHGKDSLRFCGETTDTLPEIFVMGCSYTYGMGIDDSATLAFRLQKALPNYQVKNFAVPGYGTVQSYLQLKQALNNGDRPAMVIINYADFHDDRNALSPIYRRHLYRGFLQSNEGLKKQMVESRIPYWDMEHQSVHWVDWKLLYQEWKWRDILASVNFLQDMQDQYQGWKLAPAQNSLAIFKQIHSLCLSQNIPLLICGISQTEPTKMRLQQLHEAGLDAVDISLDLKSPDWHNQPYDEHPNAAAHKHFSKRILEHIMIRLNTGTTIP